MSTARLSLLSVAVALVAVAGHLGALAALVRLTAIAFPQWVADMLLPTPSLIA